MSGYRSQGGEEAQPIEQIRLDGSLALVVGSEGDGLRRLTKDSCDYLVKLPMRGRLNRSTPPLPARWRCIS